MQNEIHSPQQTEDEAAIRQVIERIQEGYTAHSGEIFASAFAPIHDYVVVNGMLVPGMTREANAEVHQRLFEGTMKSALGADLRQIESHLEIRNLRFLSPELAVVHFATIANNEGQLIATAVMQKQAGEWLIVAYHNAPVLGQGGAKPA